MSALNGDKSRYNRERKKKIARRQRTREIIKQEATGPKSAKGSTRAHGSAVSA